MQSTLKPPSAAPQSRASQDATRLGAALAAVSALATAAFAIPSNAFAQRGGGYTLDGAPPTTPGSGFPGMFDSNVADKGSIVVDAPSLSVDYGVTERVTVGTSGTILLSPLVGVPALYLKTRYRFLATDDFGSAFTVHAGYGTNRILGSDTSLDSYVLSASNNSTYYFSDRMLLNAFTYGLKLGLNLRANDGLEYQNLSLTTLLVGGTYQWWVTRWFGPAATVAVSAYSNVSTDSSTLSASLNLGNGDVGSGLSFARAMFDFRLGRWLLSPQLVYFFGLGSSGSGGLLLPWINGSVKW